MMQEGVHCIEDEIQSYDKKHKLILNFHLRGRKMKHHKEKS